MPPSKSMLSLSGTVSISRLLPARSGSRHRSRSAADRGSGRASRTASPPRSSRRWCRSRARRCRKPRSLLMLAKKRLKRACGAGAIAVTTSNGLPSTRLGTRSRLSWRQKPISRSTVLRRASSALLRRRQAAAEEVHQRLGEERVVIGRAMADLHRRPHLLGQAAPGRVDDRRGRRAGDEGARQIEQQRGVLVGAGVEPLQRHQEIAAAKIRIADQVEGRIGRNETLFREKVRSRCRAQPWMIRSSSATGTASTGAAGLPLGMLLRKLVDQGGHRPADGEPVRVRLIAGRDNGVAQGVELRRVVQLRQPGAREQRPKRRVGERRLVELAQMRIAAARAEQQRVAQVIERRSGLGGRQRPVCVGEKCQRGSLEGGNRRRLPTVRSFIAG